MRSTALTHAIEFLSRTEVAAVRLHAARTLGQPGKFGDQNLLREESERDMLARDVRDLFLLPYAQASKSGRLKGGAAGIHGPVLTANASPVLEALFARGCVEPREPVGSILAEMRSRVHPLGFFFEPDQIEDALGPRVLAHAHRFVLPTALYLRFLLMFDRIDMEVVVAALDWLVDQQDEDGAFRPPLQELRRDETLSYVRTRAVAAAFAELPGNLRRRYAEPLARLARAWSDRILDRFEEPDAVLTALVIGEDPRGPARSGPGPELDPSLLDRIIYFPLEDLWLALAIGAERTHPHLSPWIGWLLETQRSDGSWRLRNPTLRERLLLSDPNGRLRAEALYLTDEWITLRAAQILRLAGGKARSPSRIASRVVA